MDKKTNCYNPMCSVLMFSIIERIIELENYLDKEYEDCDDTRSVRYFNCDVVDEIADLYDILP